MRNIPAGHNVLAEIVKMLGLIVACVAGLSTVVAMAVELVAALAGGNAPVSGALAGPIAYGGLPVLIGLALYLFGRAKSRPLRAPP